MEIEEFLDWQLERAKAHPMDIKHDFTTRFRVWVQQILPGRLNEIRQQGGDLEYIMRMVTLTAEDVNRLRRRAVDEATWDDMDHHDMVDPNNVNFRCTALLITFYVEIEKYTKEVKK